jgi:hypothetical protein
MKLKLIISVLITICLLIFVSIITVKVLISLFVIKIYVSVIKIIKNVLNKAFK